MVVAGLTGGIASGKTAVSDALGRLGAVIIDADLLAREVVRPGTDGLAAVVHRFGTSMLTADGELDRAALGAMVFAEPAARADLESIIHPRVRVRAAELTARAAVDVVVVQVIPLLVETGQAGAFDCCVVVDVDPETQLRRLINRSGWSEAEARSRIDAQASRDERLAAATWVIDNSGAPDALDDQVARLSQHLTSNHQPHPPSAMG